MATLKMALSCFLTCCYQYFIPCRIINPYELHRRQIDFAINGLGMKHDSELNLKVDMLLQGTYRSAAILKQMYKKL